MPQRQHAHPLTIFFNFGRVFYLIVIPVLRGFWGALRWDFAAWLQGAWVDILILLLMLGIAVLRWHLVTYSLDSGGIHVRSGVIRHKHTHITWERIITLSMVYPFFYRPIHAVRLRADTMGGSFKDADFSILLTPRQAESILSVRREPPLEKEAYDYLPRTFSILAMSLLTSNSFAGIIFMATFFSQAGKILGNEFSQMLIGTLEEAARTMAFGIIPPAAAVIAYVLLGGWTIGFLLAFFRYKNMLVSRREKTLSVKSGLLTQREYCIARKDVYFLDIRQSVLTKIFGLFSLHIYAVGYGKQKDDISCIIPTEHSGVFQFHRRRLFPGFTPSPRVIAPPRTGILRFIGQPLAYCLGIPLATALLIYFFNGWTRFILFVGLMSMAPALMFLTVRLIDFFTGGVGFDGEYYTLRYSKGFLLHTVVIPADKIVLVDMWQSIFQRPGKLCDLRIYTKAESRSAHRCRNLKAAAVQDLFTITGI